MKKVLSIMLTIAIPLFFISCSGDSDGDSSRNPSEFIKLLCSHTWVYTEDTPDESRKTTYTFTPEGKMYRYTENITKAVVTEFKRDEVADWQWTNNNTDINFNGVNISFSMKNIYIEGENLIYTIDGKPYKAKASPLRPFASEDFEKQRRELLCSKYWAAFIKIDPVYSFNQWLNRYDEHDLRLKDNFEGYYANMYRIQVSNGMTIDNLVQGNVTWFWTSPDYTSICVYLPERPLYLRKMIFSLERIDCTDSGIIIYPRSYYYQD